MELCCSAAVKLASLSIRWEEPWYSIDYPYVEHHGPAASFSLGESDGMWGDFSTLLLHDMQNMIFYTRKQLAAGVQASLGLFHSTVLCRHRKTPRFM